MNPFKIRKITFFGAMRTLVMASISIITVALPAIVMAGTVSATATATGVDFFGLIEDEDSYDGIISTQNGVANNDVYIFSPDDLEGNNLLAIDVDWAAGTADTTTIDASIAPEGLFTINVKSLTLPENLADPDYVDVVFVLGETVSGDNFILGEVAVNPDTFLTFEFDDVFTSTGSGFLSIGLSVTGLSDLGMSVTSLAPAVQSMWNTTVGTLHQRQGAVRDQKLDNNVSVWGRYFNASGDIDPSGTNNNDDFSMDVDGYEVGVDIALTDEVRLGLMASQSNGDMGLNNGVGSADLNADTIGVYLTWLSGPWTVDLSYRNMDFDGDVKSGLFRGDVDGDANGYNLEAGYAFMTDSNWVVEPQLQYSTVDVDLDDMNNSYGAFKQTDSNSALGRLGVMLRKSYQNGNNIWTPYFSVNALEEFDGDNEYNINGFTGKTSTGGTSFMAEGGINAQISGVVVFAGLNYLDGDAQDDWLGGQVGVRYPF
ncbi:MAG: autotransporter outer membrane beta-barrel domain-containing protein [Porticoccaceae bacterium]|nr:autotransporter outer membrane beta-barrel domain-containing protein [Porticoccaceae bacterium]